jgi:6-phosphogluconate dehydrogenase
MSSAQIGLVGLAVMGQNLARNIERNGYKCAVFNRTTSVTHKFVEEFPEAQFVPAETIQEFVSSLERPRKIILMVKAGSPVDAILSSLLPLLQEGDIIMDGGNAHYSDTVRREAECREKGIFFLGVGISGGEEGALNGASIMPGGDKNAWAKVSDVLEKISAEADGKCTTYIGPDGAGHFVKMVHNGIEYGDMQLIAEAYMLLVELGGFTNEELSSLFGEWNKGPLQSFLIEITAKIFRKKDDIGSGHVIDKILDVAGQKGTGRWTVQSSLDIGISIPTISAAVDARALSAIKQIREKGATVFSAPPCERWSDKDSLARIVHDSLYCAKVLSYAQGMDLLKVASQEFSWNLNLGEIAAIWRGGCIIRARFLNDIREAYNAQPQLENLTFASTIATELERTVGALREIASAAVSSGIPIPALSSSLAYFDSIRSARLPQSLTQAQRDFFGAHTYKRIDTAGTFHTNWED